MRDPTPPKLDYESPAKKRDAITLREAVIAILALAALAAFFVVMDRYFPMGG